MQTTAPDRNAKAAALQLDTTESPAHAMIRVSSTTHPAGRNGQGFVLLAGFLGYGLMFTAALTVSFVACSIAF